MLKRREFLQSSAAVATIGFFGTPTHARRSPTHIDFVIVDEQLEDSVAFAEELVQRGAKPFELQQDIGRLWFGKLGNAFTRGKTLAGLTVHSDLLVCESFARDRGARLRYEGSHDCRGTDVLTHALRLPREESSFSTALVAADVRWPRALAARLTELTICDGTLHEDRCSTRTPRTLSHPGSLFSWVIA
jgi:hypothetical protein